MLTCEDINEFIVAYLDGELDPDLRRRFDAHVADCGCCQDFFEQYTETIELVRKERNADVPDVPDELADRTLAFLKEELNS